MSDGDSWAVRPKRAAATKVQSYFAKQSLQQDETLEKGRRSDGRMKRQRVAGSESDQDPLAEDEDDEEEEEEFGSRKKKKSKKGRSRRSGTISDEEEVDELVEHTEMYPPSEAYLQRQDIENMIETFYVYNYLIRFWDYLSLGGIEFQDVTIEQFEAGLKYSDSTSILIEKIIISFLLNLNIQLNKKRADTNNWEAVLVKAINVSIRAREFCLPFHPLLNSEKEPIPFKTLSPALKVLILKELVDSQLVYCQKVHNFIEESYSNRRAGTAEDLEFHVYARDQERNKYYFLEGSCRLYKESPSLEWTAVSNKVEDLQAYCETLSESDIKTKLETELIPRLVEEQQERERIEEARRIRREKNDRRLERLGVQYAGLILDTGRRVTRKPVRYNFEEEDEEEEPVVGSRRSRRKILGDEQDYAEEPVDSKFAPYSDYSGIRRSGRHVSDTQSNVTQSLEDEEEVDIEANSHDDREETPLPSKDAMQAVSPSKAQAPLSSPVPRLKFVIKDESGSPSKPAVSSIPPSLQVTQQNEPVASSKMTLAAAMAPVTQTHHVPVSATGIQVSATTTTRATSHGPGGPVPTSPGVPRAPVAVSPAIHGSGGPVPTSPGVPRAPVAVSPAIHGPNVTQGVPPMYPVYPVAIPGGPSPIPRPVSLSSPVANSVPVLPKIQPQPVSSWSPMTSHLSNVPPPLSPKQDAFKPVSPVAQSLPFNARPPPST